MIAVIANSEHNPIPIFLFMLFLLNTHIITKKINSCNKYTRYNHTNFNFAIEYHESIKKGGKDMSNCISSSAILLVLFILLVIILGAYI